MEPSPRPPGEKKKLQVKDKIFLGEWSTVLAENRRFECRVSSHDLFTYEFKISYSPSGNNDLGAKCFRDFGGDYLVLFETGDPSVISKNSEYI